MDILLPLLGCSFIHLFCSWNADPNESSLFPQLDPPLRSKKEQKHLIQSEIMETIFPSYDLGILISENTGWHIGRIHPVKMISYL